MALSLGPVTIPRSEVRLVESSLVEETYQLHVGLPSGYEEAGKPYPVVYASPAFPDFFFLWPIINSMNVSGELPEVILVGIGYPVDEPRHIVLRRLRDHMPTPDEKMDQDIIKWAEAEPVGVAKAGHFLDFIREELQPFINEQYKTRPDDSTYAGFSSSGLFGLHVLFNRPDTFQRYILGSPPIFRGDKAILEAEQAYAASHDDLPAAIALFALALLVGAALMGLLPGLMERLPVEDRAGRLLSIYEGRLWRGMRVRTLLWVQFSLFVLALLSFAGWVFTKPGPA